MPLSKSVFIQEPPGCTCVAPGHRTLALKSPTEHLHYRPWSEPLVPGITVCVRTYSYHAPTNKPIACYSPKTLSLCQYHDVLSSHLSSWKSLLTLVTVPDSIIWTHKGLCGSNPCFLQKTVCAKDNVSVACGFSCRENKKILQCEIRFLERYNMSFRHTIPQCITLP